MSESATALSDGLRDQRPRVLITEGDNVGVLAMARGLSQAGYEPWVTVARRDAPIARSRAVVGATRVPDPAVSADGFAQEVAALARTIDPVAVVPGGERGMLALADREPMAMNGSRVAVCDRTTVYRATDKSSLSDLAGAAGLQVPDTYSVSAEDAARGELPAKLPAVVKPPRTEIPVGDGFSSYNVQLASTRAEVAEALRSFPGQRGLVQPYHEGSLSAVGGVFWEGRIVAAVHQRALRTWPVNCGEMAFAVAVDRDPELESSIERLLGSLGWSGMFQMQFIETDEGRLLIDLNPRIYGSLSLALAAGQNLPAVWVDLLVGGEAAPGPYHTGVSFRNELLDARAVLATARTTKLGGLAREVAPRANAYAFYESGDPMPLLALAPTLAAKLRSRTKQRAPGR